MEREDRPAVIRPYNVTSDVILLDQIRHRPGMYLGNVSVIRLRIFLAGLRFAEESHNVPINKRLVDPSLDGFEEWVSTRHNHEHMSISSFEVALLRVGSAELFLNDIAHIGAGLDEAAFALWFDWYDQFRREKGGS